MIKDIRLQHFRSYTDDTFEFGTGVNIIVGPNASGKTNLLESLLMVTRGGSYRVTGPGLVQFDKNWARIDASTTKGQRLVKLDGRSGVMKRLYSIDGQEYHRLPLSKKIPSVLFEPDHLRLLNGSPERRRTHLDDLLEQSEPEFGKLRRSYQRALIQRNSLLKKGQNVASSQMFAWNIRLSELGGQIAVARHKLSQELATRLKDLYPAIAHDTTKVTLEYVSSCGIENYSTNLLKKLEANIDLDYQRGFTSYGPHRDDLSVQFDGRDVRDVASRGEVRTLLLGLKIVELQILESKHAQKPILLLDDVFSELDGARRQALTSFLQSYQTFITTTDADVVIQHFMDKCTIIPTSRQPKHSKKR